MSPFTVVIHSAVLLALADAVGSGACEGQLAGALTSKTVSSEELFKLCSSHYSEAVCLAAGKSLAQLPSTLKSDLGGSKQLEHWADAACSAVEAAASQQRALLQRSARADSATAPADLASIRSSAAVHKLSLDVAQHKATDIGTADAQAKAAGRYEARSDDHAGETLDEVLHHKALPIPHGRFFWEKNHSVGESTDLENAVALWKTNHTKTVDITSVNVINRGNAFINYTSTNLARDAAAHAKAWDSSREWLDQNRHTPHWNTFPLTALEEASSEEARPAKTGVTATAAEQKAAHIQPKARGFMARASVSKELEDLVDEVMSSKD